MLPQATKRVAPSSVARSPARRIARRSEVIEKSYSRIVRQDIAGRRAAHGGVTSPTGRAAGVSRFRRARRPLWEGPNAAFLSLTLLLLASPDRARRGRSR